MLITATRFVTLARDVPVKRRVLIWRVLPKRLTHAFRQPKKNDDRVRRALADRRPLRVEEFNDRPAREDLFTAKRVSTEESLQKSLLRRVFPAKAQQSQMIRMI